MENLVEMVGNLRKLVHGKECTKHYECPLDHPQCSRRLGLQTAFVWVAANDMDGAKYLPPFLQEIRREALSRTLYSLVSVFSTFEDKATLYDAHYVFEEKKFFQVSSCQVSAIDLSEEILEKVSTYLQLVYPSISLIRNTLKRNARSIEEKLWERIESSAAEAIINLFCKRFSALSLLEILETHRFCERAVMVAPGMHEIETVSFSNSYVRMMLSAIGREAETISTSIVKYLVPMVTEK